MHIKKRLAVLCCLVGTVFVPVLSLAQTPSVRGAEQRAEELKKAAEKRAEDAKRRLDKVRQQAEERIKQQREKVQQKLSEIRDARKQRLAKQIAGQFEHINQVWTDHFTKLLDRLDVVLQKIQTRAGKAALLGKDVSSVTAAIQSAKMAITSARNAVEEQAKKTYTIDPTTVSGGAATSTVSADARVVQGLRAAFKATRDQLFKSLFALRDGAIKDARASVQNALKVLRQIPGVDMEPSEHAATTTQTTDNQ